MRFLKALAMMAAAWAPAALAQDAANLANPKIVILEQNGDGGYRPAKNAALADVRKRMIARDPLKQYVQFVSPVRVARTLGVFAQECGRVNMWYSPSARAITVCYEFMQMLEETAEDLGPTAAIAKAPVKLDRNAFIAGAFAGVMLHETAHAFFDLLDVPVFGREEDAADQIAAFVAVQFQRQVAEAVVGATALMMWSWGDKPTTAMDPKDPRYPKLPDSPNAPGYEEALLKRCAIDPMCAWSDEHGSGTQRFFNMSCIIYGSDPKRYAHWKAAGWIASTRDCVAEYQRAHKAFAATIYPFIDTNRMKQVQQTQWLLTKETPP